MKILRTLALMGALAAAPCAQADVIDHNHGYSPPTAAEINTAYDLRDVYGRSVRPINLRGQWVFLYFGYSRCTTTCPVALPLMIEAAQRLDARGIPATAAFVDIDAPAQGMTPRRAELRPTAARGHDVHDPSVATIALARTFGDSLLVLTGSRAQVNHAVRQFLVLRDHMPPREGETGHSINHSTAIYVVKPDGALATYLYHDASVDALVNSVLAARGR